MNAIAGMNPILRNPDWLALRIMDPEQAAPAIRSILLSLDPFEKQVFALRGMCAMLIEDRQLYRWVVDEEVGDYYASFDRFLKTEFPNSWSYIRDALRAVRELKDMPFADLLHIRRANIEQLKKVSSNIRTLPDVIQAAKQLPEKAFVAKLNAEHSQALEVKQPVVMASKDDCAEFEAAIARSMELGATTRAEAIRDISVNYLLDHPLEDAEATA